MSRVDQHVGQGDSRVRTMAIIAVFETKGEREVNRSGNACEAGVIRIKVLCLLVLAGLLAGCAPKKIIYPHRDWASTPAPSKNITGPGGTAPAVTPFPIPSVPPFATGGPIIEPPTTIREMELDSGLGEESRVEPQADAEVAYSSREKIAEPATPQRYASMHLVEQAKTSLDQGRLDEAISMYEQAVRVDVYNGEAFLGLARAWHMKGFHDKSLEFAKRADVLFQGRPARLKEAYLLQAEIHRQMGDTGRAETFLREASRL